MPNSSDFLRLILPVNREYENIWDEPLNSNFEVIDAWAKGIDEEITSARFGKENLTEMLLLTHETDGTLKPVPELVAARNSFLYGNSMTEGLSTTNFDLWLRLDQGDKEVHSAREGRPTLLESISERSYVQNQVRSGLKAALGYPAWLGSVGANITISGTPTELNMLIDGKRARVRTSISHTITGAAGTKALYATYQEAGVVITPPSNTGTTSSVTGLNEGVRLFHDPDVDFVAAGVKPGDIIEILGTNSNSGLYRVLETNPVIDISGPTSSTRHLKIHGIFPGGVLASLAYTVSDPYAVTLGFDELLNKAEAPGKFYFGEAEFDGLAVTDVKPIYFGDTFIGEWRPVDVTTTANVESIWEHNMLTDLLHVSVQVCQVNDGSQPVEELAQGAVYNNQAFNFSDSLGYNQGNWDAGTTDATYTDGNLTGAITASLTGVIQGSHSAIVQWTKNRVYVKNPVANILYRDYAGNNKLAGYVRVVIKKRV